MTASEQEHSRAFAYRGTSLTRNLPTLAPYSRPMPRSLWWFYTRGENLH